MATNEIRILPPPQERTALVQRPDRRFPNKNTYRIVGGVHVTFGILCIVLAGLAIQQRAPWSHLGIGLWGGVLFIVTGCCGYSASLLTKKYKVTAFLIMSIASVLVAMLTVILCAHGAIRQTGGPVWIHHVFGHDDDGEHFYHAQIHGPSVDHPDESQSHSVNVFLAVVGGCEALLGLFSVCIAYKRRTTDNPGSVMQSGSQLSPYVVYTVPASSAFIVPQPGMLMNLAPSQPGCSSVLPSPTNDSQDAMGSQSTPGLPPSYNEAIYKVPSGSSEPFDITKYQNSQNENKI
ncbi:uncharacterized protein LOC106157304 [Lingula anatina]|uniref:Uncharacterized protein LOC106157304 n=1 Tax=Lingula anatina TaxID=7574 RepID=A0A1S3HTI8_LINAN|nr:uncharacterized protein LOC106157304 [Lingula anatina]|eukprot:XP_013388374.1 uncharacterized protein LOC106157304 [Lingula anatina]